MKFGVCVPNYGDYSVKDLRMVALEAETLCYDSVWLTDHILMPKNSGTPYERILESLTCMAYLAPITEKVKLGISSLIIAMRNPVIAAKQLATIDNLSSGRVMLAVGAGWNEKEFSTLGASFHDRGRRVDESIRLFRALWSGEEVFEDGRDARLSLKDAAFEPRPVQKRLTMWVGGVSEAAMKRAIALGDAWHPNVVPLDQFKGMVAKFRGIPGGEKKDICVRIGVDSRSDRSDFVGPQGEKRVMLSGNRKENGRIIEELASLGVGYMIITTSPDGKTPVENQLDSLRMVYSRA
ncbi:MAG: TIGR03619 family F420-dependent LLM class oxidoreductase [Nitrososphaerota archaeon]|jgi:probable F420-dependent oxidoreductase|nr:TIGR03619 family F420-dependent LLM class oxidoreductase [Nitrososphaerota archaeon]MDG6903193.1 TIGR03619 family F420-dependent LLM class oxidoreductase [Nitrososphaerota archaeon]MDG6911671.1 TIGR03619 family F420-dependent LLM class oxidoreductase [Nitrososphaerota archaeon]MDG6940573.1 TIGR03619 family F420-dependent LLM class oxidoreductase [Nitrososphaerota archaeon]MDG6960884.1 TIGR03619 family F420-dependent LLM class oxidoreductase [Nitrososphaerota archaeon]